MKIYKIRYRERILKSVLCGKESVIQRRELNMFLEIMDFNKKQKNMYKNIYSETTGRMSGKVQQKWKTIVRPIF